MVNVRTEIDHQSWLNESEYGLFLLYCAVFVCLANKQTTNVPRLFTIFALLCECICESLYLYLYLY